METFNEEMFLKLAGKTDDLVISIYTPTSKQSTDSYHGDKTTFKNQLKAIGTELEDRFSLREDEIKNLLRPAQELLDDVEFWKHNSDMLAFFISKKEAEYYQLPIKVDKDEYFIGKRPFLLPLLPALNHHERFYLLYLDLNRIRLFEGSRYSLNEVELDPEEIAVSFIEEEKLEEKNRSIQGQGSVGMGGTMFHGHGEGSGEERKVNILNYFHRMTEMLEPKLNQRPLPLFLAGVDYLIPLFHQASKYPNLQEGHVGGAQLAMDMGEFQKKAWAVAEPHFSVERGKRKENFEFRASRKLALSRDPKSLIKAAFTGVVDELFVNSEHKHLWGTYDAESFTVQFDHAPTGDNHCLVDLAAVKVMENGGKVYMLPPEEMPDKTLFAGTLRHELQ